MSPETLRDMLTTNFVQLRLRQELPPDMAELSRTALSAIPHITDIDELGALAYEARGQLDLDLSHSAYSSFWFAALCKRLLRHAKNQIPA